MPFCKDNLSNEDLVDYIKNGEYEYFSELISRMMPHIKSVALKYKGIVSDTDDLVGEGIASIFSAVKSFDGKKASFSTFSNLCIDRAIAAKVKSAVAGKRIPNGLLCNIEESGLSVESAEDSVIRKEEDDLFNSDIRKVLTELERKVLYLFLNGDSYSSISEELGISVKSVDSALQRIRNKLRNKS